MLFGRVALPISRPVFLSFCSKNVFKIVFTAVITETAVCEPSSPVKMSSEEYAQKQIALLARCGLQEWPLWEEMSHVGTSGHSHWTHHWTQLNSWCTSGIECLGKDKSHWATAVRERSENMWEKQPCRHPDQCRRRRGGAPGSGDEIPLQSMVRTLVEQRSSCCLCRTP